MADKVVSQNNGDDSWKVLVKIVLSMLVAMAAIVIIAAAAVRIFVKPTFQHYQLRDTIHALAEQEGNGFYVYMVNADQVAFCTTDRQLFEQARDIFEDPSRSPEVILQYRTRLAPVYGDEGCWQEKFDDVFVITGIKRVFDE